MEDLNDITLETMLEEGEDMQFNEIAGNMVLQSLEVINEHLKVKQWKIRELEEREARLRKRL